MRVLLDDKTTFGWIVVPAEHVFLLAYCRQLQPLYSSVHILSSEILLQLQLRFGGGLDHNSICYYSQRCWNWAGGWTPTHPVGMTFYDFQRSSWGK